MKSRNFLAAVFDTISETINGAERSILDLISVFVPWAVPVIPAYLTYFHTLEMMNFPIWVAQTAAFVVEALGLVSVATAIRFWKNNQQYKSQQEKAPFWLAVFVYLFYVVIVLTVNVILEIEAATRSGTVILAIGLFSLLSFPAAVLISIRAQYRAQLDDRQERKQERRQARGLSYAAETSGLFSGDRRPKLSKVCACGCGESFTTTHPDKIYKTDAHRKRADRARTRTGG